jgi:tRNA-2-methylthio-N6-dimethylallyladenosine synthase
MEEQIPADVKSERLQRLQSAITRNQRRFNAGFAGRTVDVLLERPGKLPGQLVGRSPYLQAVQVMAPAHCIGSVRRVTVDEIGSNSLFGSLADESRAVTLTAAGA